MKIVSKTIAGNSFVYTKITEALKKHAPDGIEFVHSTKEADLAILHVNGRFHQFTKYIEKLKKLKKKYVVAQYCLRSTRYPRTEKWREMWEGAQMVWSYYPLNDYIREEGGDWEIPNFYHSPLGAEAELFSNKGDEEKEFIAMTSGWDTSRGDAESIKEVMDAAESVGEDVFHLGKTHYDLPNVLAETGITDLELASRIRSCKYVSALRSTEGFEIPAVEALFCGVRPILFDQPHYRLWYDKWGIFIPEGTKDEVFESLSQLFFVDDYQPVTDMEREEAVEVFNWKRIVTEFWRRCCGS